MAGSQQQQQQQRPSTKEQVAVTVPPPKKGSFEPEPIITNLNAQKDKSVPIQRSKIPYETKRFAGPLFWFPYNVNEVTTRFVSLQTVVVCLISIICRKEPWLWYVMCGLFGDYCLRIIGGARFSVAGAIAEWASEFFPVTLIPGAPKQFAALCGAMFSGAAVIAYWSPDNSTAAGAVMSGLLLGAAFLEAAFNFCLGCWMFNYLVRFKIIPANVNEGSERFWSEAEKLRIENDTRLNEGHPITKYVYDSHAEDSSRTLPFKYKQKTDEMVWEDFNVIKHLHIHYFSFILGAVGLAAVWAAADPVLKTETSIWQGIGIFSAVAGSAYVLIYIAKIIYYPRKVYKEWIHPVKANFFSTITISLLMFSYISITVDLDMAKAFFWIGAPLQMLQTVILVSRWIHYQQSFDSLSPTWMLPVVGNIVSAIVAPLLAADYAEYAWLWWSFSFVMYIVLFALTFNRIMFGGVLENKLHNSLFIWGAAPACIFVSYVNMVGFDAFAKFAFYLTLVTFWVLGWLFFRSYFGRHSFDQSYWAFIFPLDTFAFATITYYDQIRSSVALAMVVISLIIVNAGAIIVLANSVTSLFKLRMFVPEEKWGPLSFTKVIHFAIREAILELGNRASVLSGKNGPCTDEDAEHFRSMYERMLLIFEIHSKHEDMVLFPALRLWFPNIAGAQDEEHEVERKLFAEISALIGTGPGGREAFKNITTKAENLKAISERFPVLIAGTLHHLDSEEENLAPLIRKYVSLAMQKEIGRKMFELSSPTEIRELIHFTIEFAPYHHQRARFLHCLRWIFPERFQLFGKWLYETTDPWVWSRLVTDVPDIVPRNASFWQPYL